MSYWRRIMQARLDVVRATSDGGSAVDNLRDVLADVRVTTTRALLVEMVADPNGELDRPAGPEHAVDPRGRPA